MKASRLLSTLLVFTAPTTLLACIEGGDCTPEPDITVTLERASEDVRSLPVLASGKSTLLGIDVPDSHGDERFTVRITNATSVTIEQLSFQKTIDGAAKDIRISRQQQNDNDVENGGTAHEGGVFKFFWRMKNQTEYLLPEAKTHTGKVSLSWKHSGCRVQTGVSTLEQSGLVKSAASASHLELVPGSVEAFRPDLLRGGKVKLQLQSKVGDGLVGIGNASLQVTYFNEGAVPTLGLANVDASKLALQTEQTATTSLSAMGTLDVYTSTNASVSAAAYDYAGLAATTGLMANTGKALVTLKVSSAKQSQPGVPAQDVITALVDYK